MFRARMFAAALCAAAHRGGTRAAAQTPAPLTIDQAVAEAIDHNLVGRSPSATTSRSPMRASLTAGLRPNPVVTASVMLPDATIFDSNVNPTRGHRPRRRAARARRQARPADRGGAGGPRRHRAPAAEHVRTLTLNVQSAFIDVQQAQADLQLARESLTAFNDSRRHQHRARAIGRSRAGRARAIAAGGAAVPERRAEPRGQAGGREPPAARAARADRRGADRGRRRAAPRRRRRRAPTRCSSRRSQLRPDLKALERDQARSDRRRPPAARAGQGRLHRQRRVPSAGGARLAVRQRVGPVLQRAASALQPEPGRGRASAAGSAAGRGAHRGAAVRHHQRAAQRLGAVHADARAGGHDRTADARARRATSATPPPIPTAAARPASSSCSTRSGPSTTPCRATTRRAPSTRAACTPSTP